MDEPGDAAIRGGTIDIFPAGQVGPVRLEMNGGTIVDVRAFDPLDQRSRDAIATVSLVPVAEAFTLPGEEVAGIRGRLLPPGPLETLFDYVPDAALSLEPAVEERITARIDLVREGYEARRLAHQATDGAAIDPPDRLYLTLDEIASGIAGRNVLAFDDNSGDELAERIPERQTDNPKQFAALVRSRVQVGDAVILCIPERDGTPPRKLGLPHRVLDGWHEAGGLAPRELGILRLKLTESFRLDGLSVLAGPSASGAQTQQDDASAALLLQDLRIGDLVVEPTHGLARLSGLAMVDDAGRATECLVLEFAGDKRLLVPATQAGGVWRYSSAEASVKPDSLTGEAWLNRRRQVEEEIAEAAAGIVTRARAREAEKASAITPRTTGFAHFTRRVPYTLTVDQDKAIEATLRDLRRGRPMGRLVCGDVAFGKTEVALHAAAAAVLAGKQVAVIAPTTLLARQHLETFGRRFAGLGVAIDKLIRSAKSAEGRQVTRGLARRGADRDRHARACRTRLDLPGFRTRRH